MAARRGFTFTRALVLALLAWPGSAAWAQPKTDVVRLSNGDHVTGEISSMKLARLELKTDDAGTIAFEWDNIASVESTHQFEVGTTDDRRLLGSLQVGVGRVVRVVTNSGDVVLPMAEVTTIYPIGAGFWKKLDGSANMGYSYTRSSAIGQFSLNWDTTFRRPSFVVMLSVSGTVTEQPGSEKDDRGAVGLQYSTLFEGAGSPPVSDRLKTTRASASFYDRRSAEWLAAALSTPTKHSCPSEAALLSTTSRPSTRIPRRTSKGP